MASKFWLRRSNAPCSCQRRKVSLMGDNTVRLISAK
jgi:hypothetical protein